ncbi:MAG: 1-acyl-sn-glycerol-3-phosphate acyltransferase [Lactobacillales bacterium]|jgi:1-acyl-sn-glycerol-3-phosphate acyltransferase|nr:1-acyl-sn-glycerol-3-phosphate acyltransferase [Lactobacillales bacterium]
MKTHGSFMWIRSFIYTIVLYIGTLLFFIVFIPVLVLPKKMALALPISWSWTMVRLLRLICGVKLDIKGFENLPAQNGYIVAAKHQSAFETIVFHSVVPYTFYILKKELMFIPIAGIYFLKVGCIPIDRGGGTKTMKKMLTGVQKRLAEKMNLIIFPEGTRTKPGSEAQYKPGVAFLYEQCNVPVVPVALNTGYCWPKNQMKKNAGTVTIEFLKPIAPGLSKRDFLNKLETTIESAQKELPDPFKGQK